MKILDLFAGVGGERRRGAIESMGHDYVTLDLLSKFRCTITADVWKISAADLGPFDFVWASPPCEAFSVASVGHHWQSSGVPKTMDALAAVRLVERTLGLIREISPSRGFLIENPRGMLRKLPVLRSIRRYTVTYCQYGDSRQKPTDLWGHVPGWGPRPVCRAGDLCHESAPRGSKTGTQGVAGSAERAVVPLELWREVLAAASGASSFANRSCGQLELAA